MGGAEWVAKEEKRTGFDMSFLNQIQIAMNKDREQNCHQLRLFKTESGESTKKMKRPSFLLSGSNLVHVQ